MLAELLLNKYCSENNTVQFEEKHCLRNRLNTNKCKVCVSHCKSGALSSDEIGIQLNEEQCTGCLLCMATCPNDAFIFDFDYSSFFLEVLQKDTAVLSCKKVIHNSEHVHIPCIGVLSEPILASLNCISKNTISINVSVCPNCKNVQSLEHFKETINTLLSKFEGRCEFKINAITEKVPDPVNTDFHGKK